MVQIKIIFNEDATNLTEFVGLNSGSGDVINNKIGEVIDEIAKDSTTKITEEGVRIDQRTVVRKVMEKFNTQEVLLLASQSIAKLAAHKIKSEQENPLLQLMKAMMESAEKED